MGALDYDGNILMLEKFNPGKRLWVPFRMIYGPRREQQGEEMLNRLRSHTDGNQYRLMPYRRERG